MTVSSAARGASVTAGPQLGTAELLFRSAQQMGLQPSWVTPDGLFAVLIDGEERYINFAHSPLNSHISASLAKNKYLTRRILARHRMQNIPYLQPQSQAEAEAFLRTHKKIIAKPLRGSGSRDIHIVTTSAQLRELGMANYILEKYIAGQELRYLVLNGVVIGVYRSDYGTSVAVNRPLQCITYPASAWDPAMVSSAIQVARILDLQFAAVDYLLDAPGHAYILEVNTTPDLKWFHAPTSGPATDVARQFLAATFTKAEAAAQA